MKSQLDYRINCMNRSKSIFVFILAIVAPVFILYQSCGIAKPRYIEYEDKESTTAAVEGEDEGGIGTGGGGEAGDGPAECPPETVFIAHIQPAINTSCGGCHGSSAGGGGLILLNGNGNAPANRAALYDSTDNVNDLFDKISLNGKTHGGGNRSGDLPKAKIELWMAQEDACK